MPNRANNMRKNSKRNNKNRPTRGRQNVDRAAIQKSGRPTLVLKTHIMLQASVNTAVSFVKQINVTPFLGLFPVALEQSKFYQQYRIRKVHYTILPTSTTNTNTTAASLSSQICYSVPLYNSSIPGASQSAYLAYKNARISVLKGVQRGSFVPFVPTSQQTTNAQVMVRSPMISTKQVNPLHFGHSLLFVEQSFNAFAFIRVLVQCQFQFFHFDGQKASMRESYQDLREMMQKQIAPDLQSDDVGTSPSQKGKPTQILPVEKHPWKVLAQKPNMSVEQFQQMLSQAQQRNSTVWKTPKLIRK